MWKVPVRMGLEVDQHTFKRFFTLCFFNYLVSMHYALLLTTGNFWLHSIELDFEKFRCVELKVAA